MADDRTRTRFPADDEVTQTPVVPLVVIAAEADRHPLFEEAAPGHGQAPPLRKLAAGTRVGIGEDPDNAEPPVRVHEFSKIVNNPLWVLPFRHLAVTCLKADRVDRAGNPAHGLLAAPSRSAVAAG